MLTAKDAKNSQNASYVIAGTVVINFMILVLVLGPESTGFDPTWGPVSSLLNFSPTSSLVLIQIDSCYACNAFVNVESWPEVKSYLAFIASNLPPAFK